MSTRPPNKRTGAEDPLLYYETRRPRRSCCCICCTVTTIIIILLLLVAVLLLFVGFPLIFKNSPNLQREFIYPRSELLPKDPEFSNFAKYNISGARNLEVVVDKNSHISLGVWHILPEALVNDSVQNGKFDYSYSLGKSNYPVLLHFHSNEGNRAKYVNIYKVLRKFFHVIAFDYRGYGDSSPVTPTEEAIVADSLEIYKWMRAQTNADIYFWGHDIGSALSTHTIIRLQEDDIIPMGLFLEAPFTSIMEQLQENKLFKILFSWMPWYRSTMLEPLGANGFWLKTIDYILSVDCPIMIVHAEDDKVTPLSISEKLFKRAIEYRTEDQGDVIFHALPKRYEYGHFDIYKAPELPGYIEKHKEVCAEYKRKSE